MRFFTLLAVILFTAQSFAQDVKGYYITYDGNKVEGYFKEGDFNDASSLEFKQMSKSQYVKLSADAMKEYGVGKEFKFEKHLVQIDRSVANGLEKNPQMKTESLFLNVIIEGGTSLYSYTKEYATKFFVKSKSKTEPEQLIYKKYRLEDGTIAENNTFRQQLFNSVNCKSKSANDFLDAIYQRKELIDAVKEDNKCNGTDSKEYFNDTRRPSDFHYNAFLGLYNQKVAVDNANPPFGKDTQFTITVGVEVAYLFKSEIAALFFRLEYERFSADKSIEVQNITNTVTKYAIDVSTVNFMFGPRYNFVALDNHKVFLDGGFGLSVPFGDIDKTVTAFNGAGSFDGGSTKYDLRPSLLVGFGAGYIYNNRYGIAVRYELDKDYLDYNSYQTKFGKVGINLSYYIN